MLPEAEVAGTPFPCSVSWQDQAKPSQRGEREGGCSKGGRRIGTSPGWTVLTGAEAASFRVQPVVPDMTGGGGDTEEGSDSWFGKVKEATREVTQK